MVKITYIEPSGDTRTLDLPEGCSLMQGAVSNGVEGIVGECGGSCVCGTCHCYVDEAHLAALPAPSDDELELLACVAADRRPNSRLSCQLKAGPALEGLVATIADCQGLDF